MTLRAVRAALALGLGLAGLGVGAAPAAAADTPTRLAIAVPLIVRAESTGLIGAAALEAYTRPLGDLTRQLDAVIDKPVAIGIDPMIIVSIRVLGSAAPESAVAWLGRLASVTNPTFPLTYADSDITLGTQAGSVRVLQPESFDFAIDPTLFAPPVTDAPTPTPTGDPADPGLPSYPTTRELLAWPYSLTGIAWPRDDTVVESDLRAISSSEYSTTILSSTNLAVPAGSGASAEIDGEGILISDVTVSTALRAASHALGTDLQQAALASLRQAVATAGAAHSGDRHAVFASFDREVPTSSAVVAEVIAALGSDPAVALVPISQAIGGSPATATLVPKPQPADRVAQVARMVEAEVADRRFAIVAANPEAITANRRLQLLALLSTTWAANAASWETAAQDYVAASTALRNSIQVVESSSFNLVADRGLLPIAVSNATDQIVTVYITVRPETALLAVGDDRVELVIEPGSQGRAQIPVQAVSNGVVRLEVTLTSASGVAIGPATSAEINVQAGWETPIVVVIAAIVVAVFGGGIVRNILRRRKPADD